jgi:hypothetical protein
MKMTFCSCEIQTIDCNVIEEEVEILKAIYGEEFQTLEPTQTRFAYQVICCCCCCCWFLKQ